MEWRGKQNESARGPRSSKSIGMKAIPPGREAQCKSPDATFDGSKIPVSCMHMYAPCIHVYTQLAFELQSPWHTTLHLDYPLQFVTLGGSPSSC